MPFIPFDPAVKGFHFKNGKFNFHVGANTWKVLCGGMMYGVLDYHFAGLKLPDLTDCPAEYNPLQNYIYDRQSTAHYYTWYKFLGNWWGKDSTEDEERVRFEELKAQLATNTLTVICLYNNTAQGHHLLCHGCDDLGNSLNIHDSNHPDKMGFLLKQGTGVWRNTLDNGVWRGWFIDSGYYREKPRVPPLNWKYCRTCHVLHTGAFNKLPSPCRGGGKHIDSPNFEYFLPWGAGKGQRGWRLCDKCLCLYFDSDPMATRICPAGGLHVAMSQVGGGSLDFGVMPYDGLGENNWFRCGTCASLFWSENGEPAGQCFGGPHKRSINSPPYVLDYRTVPKDKA